MEKETMTLDQRQRELVAAASQDVHEVVPALEDDSRVIEALLALAFGAAPGLLCQVPELRDILRLEGEQMLIRQARIAELACLEGRVMTPFFKYGREVCLRMAVHGLAREAGRVRALGHVLGDREAIAWADALGGTEEAGLTADDVVDGCGRLQDLAQRAGMATA